MNAMSQKAKITLEKYRAAESLGERTRARLFETLERRVAAGDWPAQGVDVGPPQAVSPGGFVAKVLSGPIGKIGLGLVIAAVPAAWFLAQRDAREVDAAAIASARGERPSSSGALTMVRGNEERELPQKAVESAPKGAATVGQSARRAATANETGEVVAPARSGHAEPPLGRPTRPARALAPLSVGQSGRSAAPNASEGPQDTQSVAPKAANSASAAEAAPKLDTIDEEVSLLGSAHASLRAGRASEALTKLAEHKRRFPASKLAESREVARIIALCQAGQRETARAAAERFLATRSGSPLANRVRTVCADTGKK